jgi:hypothetical protein
VLVESKKYVLFRQKMKVLFGSETILCQEAGQDYWPTPGPLPPTWQVPPSKINIELISRNFASSSTSSTTVKMPPKKKVERAATENVSLGPQVREGKSIAGGALGDEGIG